MVALPTVATVSSAAAAGPARSITTIATAAVRMSPSLAEEREATNLPGEGQATPPAGSFCFSGGAMVPGAAAMRGHVFLVVGLAALLASCGVTIARLNERPDKYYQQTVSFK